MTALIAALKNGVFMGADLSRLVICLYLFALGACVTVDAPPFPAEPALAASETQGEGDAAARIRADVAWLADDAREGRETGTQGYREAADYVAARMAGLGLEPGAKGGWMQEVPFVAGTPVLDAASLSVTSPDGALHKLESLKDFIIYPSLAADAFSIMQAPAVFIGFGVHAPEFGYDDFADVDVEGKVVVYFSGSPDIFDNESRAHFNSNSLKMKEASARGAIGAIMLTTTQDEQRTPWERRVANPNYSIMSWKWPDGRVDTSGANIEATAILHPQQAALLFKGAPVSYQAARAAADDAGGPVGGFDLAVRVFMTGAMKRSNLSSPNVVGLIPGSDPVLKNEYVILTAHLDHIGVNGRLVDEGKDGINNGAMDNATGVATMLEAALRFIEEGAPKRSVMIVAVTAEEKGLLGADYFAHFPTIGRGEMVANVNLDMPVMLHAFTDVIAFGAERSSIGPVMKAALKETGIALAPDPIPQLGIFTRSDHYRFVEQGVPSIFLWTGFANGGEEKFWDFYKNHYHKPSDDISQPILYDDLARFAEINYIIARAIADAPEKPVWNIGDFFGDLFAK
ncbi:M28 family peptidase [Marinicaulis aureus]|uniref:M28 family peptidase n=1 Tax=Hyphococcus aureus TaxID=2666033 RepID=A0ABW1KZ69_9PROT